MTVTCFCFKLIQNIFNFIDNLFDKDNKKININLEDEIIEKTIIK